MLLKILVGLEEFLEGIIERLLWVLSVVIVFDCIVYLEILVICEFVDLYVKEGKFDKNVFE